MTPKRLDKMLSQTGTEREPISMNVFVVAQYFPTDICAYAKKAYNVATEISLAGCDVTAVGTGVQTITDGKE